MGLDSVGRSVVNSADAAGYMVDVRSSLVQTLGKAKEMALSIDKSHHRLQHIVDSLPALEAAMKPLQAQTLLVTALGVKINRAVEPAEKVLETFEVVHGLERVLKGDPPTDFSEYLASLSQLEEAIDYLSRNCVNAVQSINDAVTFLANSKIADKYRMYRLNERLASVLQDLKKVEGDAYDMGLLKIALTKLESEFKRILQANTTPVNLPDVVPVEEPPPDPPRDEEPGSQRNVIPILPPQASDQLQTIVERLNFHSCADNAMEIYRDSRLVAVKESLRSLQPDYLEYSTSEKIDKLAWEDLEGMIGFWVQHIGVACKILFKSERRVFARVFSSVEKGRWIVCWGKLAQAGFRPFLAFGESVVQSEAAPAKLFKLLDMYEAMEDLLPSIFEVFEGADSGCGEIRVRARELQKKIVHRASATFLRFGRDVENGSGDSPVTGERSRLCSYVVNYLKYLVSDFYGPIMSKVMRIQQNSDAKEEAAQIDDSCLARGLVLMMESLERHLLKQAKAYEDTSLGHIFMMNNLWYIVSRARECELGPLLGDTWIKDITVKVKQHTLDYQRQTWGKILAHLTRDGLNVSSGGRGAVRDLARQRLKNFTSSFEETLQKHLRWCITENELREGAVFAVMQAVVPAYRSYTQTYRGLLDGGNSVKYMKYSPEEIEQKIENLFTPRVQDNRRNGTTGNPQPST